MKHLLYIACVLCLALGLLAGILLPVSVRYEDGPPAALGNAVDAAALPPGVSLSGNKNSSNTSAQDAPLDSAENFPLLSAACSVDRAIQRQDWSALAAHVHPERGVTFTPYSTVDPESDLNFTAGQIKSLAQDRTVYTWGFEDGRGDPIQMTMLQYFERYVFDKDYTMASEIGVDRIMTGGNALENLAEAYPDCRFVDFSIPSADPVNDGMDWSSLKLVFQLEKDRWYLVGIVHGEWTI